MLQFGKIQSIGTLLRRVIMCLSWFWGLTGVVVTETAVQPSNTSHTESTFNNILEEILASIFLKSVYITPALFMMLDVHR